MGTVELYPVHMAEITVRAEQRTVDWDEGAVFTCERTKFVDKLLANGRLTEVTTGGTIVDGLTRTIPEEYAVPEFFGTNKDAPWVDETGKLVEPPRSGKGSGAAVWRNFLDLSGVEHPATDNRDELIARWEQHQAATGVAAAERRVAEAFANEASTATDRDAAQQGLVDAQRAAAAQIAELNEELDK